MRRAIHFALLSVAFFSAISCAAIDNELPPCSSTPASVNIDDNENYLAQSPRVELLEELERSEDQSKALIRYTFGNHVAGTIFAL